MKIILVTVLVSLVTSLTSFWGYNRYQDHQKWLNWRKEQDIKLESQKQAGRFEDEVRDLYGRNQITITNVEFGNGQTAKISGKLNKGFTARRILVSGRCNDYQINPGRSQEISGDGSFYISVKYVGNGDADGGKRPSFVFYPSHFLSWDEVKEIPTKYQQYSDGGGKITRDKTLPSAVTKDQEDEFIYETVNAGSAPEPDFCGSGQMVMGVSKPINLNFITKTW